MSDETRACAPSVVDAGGQQAEHRTLACPLGCEVYVPGWSLRARWEHMDQVHRDTYGLGAEHGYDVDWPEAVYTKKTVYGCDLGGHPNNFTHEHIVIASAPAASGEGSDR